MAMLLFRPGDCKVRGWPWPDQASEDSGTILLKYWYNLEVSRAYECLERSGGVLDVSSCLARIVCRCGAGECKRCCWMLEMRDREKLHALAFHIETWTHRISSVFCAAQQLMSCHLGIPSHFGCQICSPLSQVMAR